MSRSLKRAERLKARKDMYLAGAICKLNKARDVGEWPCKPPVQTKNLVRRQRNTNTELCQEAAQNSSDGSVPIVQFQFNSKMSLFSN